MKNAIRLRVDIVTPRELKPEERETVQRELREWLQGRVMRMGGNIPTQIFAAEQQIPVTSFGSSLQLELTDKGKQAVQNG